MNDLRARLKDENTARSRQRPSLETFGHRFFSSFCFFFCSFFHFQLIVLHGIWSQGCPSENSQLPESLCRCLSRKQLELFSIFCLLFLRRALVAFTIEKYNCKWCTGVKYGWKIPLRDNVQFVNFDGVRVEWRKEKYELFYVFHFYYNSTGCSKSLFYKSKKASSFKRERVVQAVCWNVKCARARDPM